MLYNNILLIPINLLLQYIIFTKETYGIVLVTRYASILIY